MAGDGNISIVTPSGAKLAGRVAAADTANDLAIIKVDNPRLLPPALPIAAAQPAAAERVFTLGYPHPDIMGTEPKLTEGIVSSSTGFRGDVRMFQVSVQVQSGNSGGPLINMKGEVVGIMVAKLDAIKVFAWTGDVPENVSYAIKTAYLRPLLESAGVNAAIPQAPPAAAAPLADLAARIKPSILLVIVE